MSLPLQLQGRYGDVFSLQLAWTPVVVLNGPAVVHEALVTHGEDTSDRPPTPVLEHVGFGPHAEGKALWGDHVLVGLGRAVTIDRI